MNKRRDLASPAPVASLGGNVTVRQDKMRKPLVPTPTKLKEIPAPEDIPSFEEFLEYILTTELLGTEYFIWTTCIDFAATTSSHFLAMHDV